MWHVRMGTGMGMGTRMGKGMGISMRMGITAIMFGVRVVGIYVGLSLVGFMSVPMGGRQA